MVACLERLVKLETLEKLVKLERSRQSELTSEQEFVENEVQDARKSVVTDTVANVVEAKSSFLESEGGTKQVEKVVKDALEVGGVLWRHQLVHVAFRQFHAVQHDMRTVTTQRKSR